MSKLPYIKFYVRDWLVDTSILNDEQKAIWIDLLCYLWLSKTKGKITGYLADVTQALRRDRLAVTLALDEMKRKGILEYEIQKDGLCVIASRRLLRDAKELKDNNNRQRRYRKNSGENNNGKVTEMSRQSNGENTDADTDKDLKTLHDQKTDRAFSFKPKKTGRSEKKGVGTFRVINSLIDYYRKSQEKKIGEPPQFNRGAASKGFRILMRQWDNLEIMRRIDNWFESNDSFAEKTSYRVEIFFQNFNNLKDGPLGQKKEKREPVIL